MISDTPGKEGGALGVVTLEGTVHGGLDPALLDVFLFVIFGRCDRGTLLNEPSLHAESLIFRAGNYI